MTFFGSLELAPAAAHPELLAAPVRAFLEKHPNDRVLVGAIDAELADTAAFCAHHGIAVEQAANCVVVEAKRGETRTLVACMIFGSDRVDRPARRPLRAVRLTRGAVWRSLERVVDDGAVADDGADPGGDLDVCGVYLVRLERGVVVVF